MRDTEKVIRELAYELWERAGRPEGRSDEFWFAARFELECREETGETAGVVTAAPPAPPRYPRPPFRPLIAPPFASVVIATAVVTPAPDRAAA